MKVFPITAMILREDRGSAKDDAGIRYELATDMAGRMMVRSGKTNQWCVITWEDVLELAIEAGVNDLLPAKEGGPS